MVDPPLIWSILKYHAVNSPSLRRRRGLQDRQRWQNEPLNSICRFPCRCERVLYSLLPPYARIISNVSKFAAGIFPLISIDFDQKSGFASTSRGMFREMGVIQFSSLHHEQHKAKEVTHLITSKNGR